MDFDKQLKNYQTIVNEAITKAIISYECRQKKLFESVNYSLLAGGKRLRPVLMLAACEMAGGKMEDCLPFAVGLEMIHNSSLIHDDLPAMDDDDLRRGRPTNHKVYGEATAILAGDVLLVRPFELMAAHAKNPGQIKAMEIIAKAAGSEGMMGGQEIDLEWEGKQADEQTILQLNALKTGALFQAAVIAGTVIAGADTKLVEAAKQYGTYFGLAFQLEDDLLDNDPGAETGKTKGSDIASGKSTYLSIYGAEKCKRLIREYTNRAVDSLSIFGGKAEFLTQLVKRMENRGS